MCAVHCQQLLQRTSSSYKLLGGLLPNLAGGGGGVLFEMAACFSRDIFRTILDLKSTFWLRF